MDENIKLHGLWDQAEWRCAWESALRFIHEDGPGLYGRSQAVTYEYDGDGEDIAICVWRNKHGLNATRVSLQGEGA
ncbi:MULTISPECIES: hypothetical protein [Halorhodospira]|uniref:hypothetical protein n=1 Tax=Halorhodospira TaxID=85108 RepID=UPI001EE93925|nr:MULTISPECIES: hypothetical protein [Halorhodospira]MCG5526888.1 hypothetical protein [Halorhodospira halophila]MCG5542775.1 hypothetical protein [Halorhodospira sp. 9628]